MILNGKDRTIERLRSVSKGKNSLQSFALTKSNAAKQSNCFKVQEKEFHTLTFLSLCSRCLRCIYIQAMQRLRCCQRWHLNLPYFQAWKKVRNYTCKEQEL